MQRATRHARKANFISEANDLESWCALLSSKIYHKSTSEQAER